MPAAAGEGQTELLSLADVEFGVLVDGDRLRHGLHQHLQAQVVEAFGYEVVARLPPGWVGEQAESAMLSLREWASLYVGPEWFPISPDGLVTIRALATADLVAVTYSLNRARWGVAMHELLRDGVDGDPDASAVLGVTCMTLLRNKRAMAMEVAPAKVAALLASARRLLERRMREYRERPRTVVPGVADPLGNRRRNRHMAFAALHLIEAADGSYHAAGALGQRLALVLPGFRETWLDLWEKHWRVEPAPAENPPQEFDPCAAPCVLSPNLLGPEDP